MIFKQLFDTKSSTYTYLISSGKGREALIIDPVLDHVDSYIKILDKLNLKLVKVIDTHIHADHITGMSKLKNETNCETVMGDKTPAEIVSIKIKDQENISIENISDLTLIWTLKESICKLCHYPIQLFYQNELSTCIYRILIGLVVAASPHASYLALYNSRVHLELAHFLNPHPNQDNYLALFPRGEL